MQYSGWMHTYVLVFTPYAVHFHNLSFHALPRHHAAIVKDNMCSIFLVTRIESEAERDEYGVCGERNTTE